MKYAFVSKKVGNQADANRFQRDVLDFINEDYIPLGGMCVSGETTGRRFTQTLILIESKEEEKKLKLVRNIII